MSQWEYEFCSQRSSVLHQSTDNKPKLIINHSSFLRTQTVVWFHFLCFNVRLRPLKSFLLVNWSKLFLLIHVSASMTRLFLNAAWAQTASSSDEMLRFSLSLGWKVTEDIYWNFTSTFTGSVTVADIWLFRIEDMKGEVRRVSVSRGPGTHRPSPPSAVQCWAFYRFPASSRRAQTSNRRKCWKNTWCQVQSDESSLTPFLFSSSVKWHTRVCLRPSSCSTSHTFSSLFRVRQRRHIVIEMWHVSTSSWILDLVLKWCGANVSCYRF